MDFIVLIADCGLATHFPRFYIFYNFNHCQNVALKSLCLKQSIFNQPMSASGKIRMKKCSVCSQMTAAMYMAPTSWLGQQICRVCKEQNTAVRKDHRDQRIYARDGYAKLVLFGVGALGFVLWHFRAEVQANKTFKAVTSEYFGSSSIGGGGRAGRSVLGGQSASQVSFQAGSQVNSQSSSQPKYQTVTLNLRSDVLFEFSNASLKSGAAETLRDVAKMVRQRPAATVVIRGYTDSIGTEQANMALSLQRAESVRDWMVKKASIPAKQLSVQGLGARDPVAPNTAPDGSDNPSGREQNRRVTVAVTGG